MKEYHIEHRIVSLVREFGPVNVIGVVFGLGVELRYLRRRVCRRSRDYLFVEDCLAALLREGRLIMDDHRYVEQAL